MSPAASRCRKGGWGHVELGEEEPRAEVVGDDDDDVASPLPRRRRDSPPPPPRRRSRVIDEDDEDDEEAGDGGGGGGGGGGVPGATAQAGDRRAPQAVGRLPSRHKAVVNALRLAAALQAQGRTSESATVTNLVATCQELLDQFQA